jgi:hypothetical protein
MIPVPKRKKFELSHLLPTDYIGNTIKEIRPLESLDIPGLTVEVWNKSFEIALSAAINARSLLNPKIKLSNLIADLVSKKAQLNTELVSVQNIHPAQNIDFNQAKKIVELQNLAGQIDKQLKFLIKIKQEKPIVRTLKSFRDKALGTAADIVSPRTRLRNK